jgi:mono/diheme cytochrome c family protein
MKVLKWVLRIVGGLVGLLALAVGFLVFRSGSKIERKVEVAVQPVAFPADAASLAEGKRLATAFCSHCHKDDFGGGKFIEMPLATLDARNLTPGRGSSVATYTDVDWVRTLRHGVRPDGRSLAIMPSDSFWHLSDADLGAIAAYLKSAPPVDRETRERSFTVLGKALVGAGQFDKDFPGHAIDHAAPRPAAPEKSASIAFGDYLVASFGCYHCHGDDFSGRQPGDPASPFAPNLTQGGAMRAWNEESFLQTVGTRQSAHMPWSSLRAMNETELRAIWRYLAALPAKATPGVEG